MLRKTESARRQAAELDLPERADEQQAVAEIGDFQATFKIPGRVSLGAAEGAKSLRIASMTVPADLAVRAAPVAGPHRLPRGQLQADRRYDAAAGQGRDLPRRHLRRPRQAFGSAKDDIVRLGFGADDKVKVERAVLKRNEGSAGLIVTTSKTDERAFKTTSATATTSRSTSRSRISCRSARTRRSSSRCCPRPRRPRQNIRDKRGVLEWSFDAKPGEVKDINFAWRVRWPKDKSMVIVPSG